MTINAFFMDESFSIADWLVAIGTIGFLVVAFEGLDAWRYQTATKRKVEFSEKALTAVYKAKSAIEDCRSPFNRLYKPEEITHEEWKQSPLNPLYKCWTVYSEVFNTLRHLEFECTIVFPGKELKVFKGLIDIRFEILASANYMQGLYADYPKLGSMDMNTIEQKHPGYTKNYNALWEQPDEIDKIKPKIENLIKEAEDFFRPILKEFYS